MIAEGRPEKSFATQLLAEEPCGDWGVDQLGEHARQLHNQLVDQEVELAPIYWRLGRVLSLARKQFARSHWGRFLASHGIHKTRAAKARAIARTFESEEAVRGLTVEEAYARRRDSTISGPAALRRKKPTKSKPARGKANLRALLEEIDHTGPSTAFQVQRMPADQAAVLLRVVEATLKRLEEMRRLLSGRAYRAAEGATPVETDS